MNHQATLPLFPVVRPLGRPDPEALAIRKNAGVEYHELTVKNALNRCLSPRMPFRWTINPYRGCEFACTYCYARYTHHFFDLTGARDFEHKIFVKKGAADSLMRKIRKSDLQGQPISIGTATDPYQPAESHYRITRSILEAFREADGLTLSIMTKSPLVLRDLDLLIELDRKHAVTVDLTMTTLDPGLARKIEQRAPDPQARLRTLRKLTAAGLSTAVLCMPVMPGINDSEDQLEPLFEAARDGGARDVLPNALFLRAASRARFWPWLKHEFPTLESRYRKLYGRGDYLSRRDRDQLLSSFRRLRLQYGFPRDSFGRG